MLNNVKLGIFLIISSECQKHKIKQPKSGHGDEDYCEIKYLQI